MEDQTLDEAAVVHHEIFLSHVRAGFTETQALELLKTLMQTQYGPEKP